MAGRARNRGSRHDATRGSETESDESEHDLVHIQCWIPSASIDLAALAAYLREYIDNTATIRPSPSPADANKAGYTISARKTLSVAECRDIIEDSRAWEKEKLSREYRRDPYAYNESDAWDTRKSKGSTASEPMTRRRRRRSPSAATNAPVRSPGENAPTRHDAVGNDDSYDREASPDGTRSSAQRHQPSIATITESRQQPTEKEKAQFSLWVPQPTISNMSKTVANDRHRA